MKIMMFRGGTTVLDERKKMKIEITSLPYSVGLILGRNEWPGLIALHHTELLHLI
jgi:hypothetical protein